MYFKSKYKDNTLNLFHPKCLFKTLPALYLSAPIEKCKQTTNYRFITEPENQGMFCQSGCQIKRALHSTAMLHGQHGVSNQRQLEFCSTACSGQQNWKMKATYGCFVKVSTVPLRIRLTKGPVIRKPCPCQDVSWIQWCCVIPSRCFTAHYRYARYPLACYVIRHGWRKIGSNYLVMLNVLSSNLPRINYSWIR